MLRTGTTIISAGTGEGKTTFLRRYAARELGRGRSIGGIASPAVFKGGSRVGYDLLDLRSGYIRLLARTAASPDRTTKVGPYHFDDQTIATGIAAILAAVRDRLDIIAIDEVGPLECDGKGWAPALEVALQDCDSTQELVIVARPSLVDELPTRFPAQSWATAQLVSPPWPG